MTKEKIIQEIQRTAAQNGGAPLGSRRFSTVTGIREATWLGKYWARWGDALCEAGFAPNQLTGAYDREHLLDLCVELSRELGRVPTANDLRLKDRQDSRFPNQKVFERLGTKAELVKLLKAHAQAKGLEDIVKLCEDYSPRASTQAPSANSENSVVGFVYLLRSGRYFKIGRSNATGRRAYELAIQLPERAELIHEIGTDDPAGIEAYWHTRFATKRKNGEWFELSTSDVAVFKRRQFM